jgi:hypothetical protein
MSRAFYASVFAVVGIIGFVSAASCAALFAVDEVFGQPLGFGGWYDLSARVVTFALYIAMDSLKETPLLAQYSCATATATTTTTTTTATRVFAGSFTARMMTEGHLDDNGKATTGTALKGTQAITLNYRNSKQQSFLTGAINSELGKMTRLKYVTLYENTLTATIPTEFGQVTALTALILAINAPTGTVPTQLGFLTALSRLSVNTNKLEGKIPFQLGQLIALTQVSLYSNEMTGGLPSDVGQLTALKSLSLRNNKLSQNLPTEIGMMIALTAVRLEENKLSGSIPRTLTLLTGLVILRLDANPKLCRLDAASTLAANKCSPEPCTFATCACTLTTCPSGATKTNSTDVNPATPFYPADDTTCCPVGASLRERRLVTDGHLDCTVGRPCVVTTGTAGKGTLASAM